MIRGAAVASPFDAVTGGGDPGSVRRISAIRSARVGSDGTVRCCAITNAAVAIDAAVAIPAVSVDTSVDASIANVVGHTDRRNTGVRSALFVACTGLTDRKSADAVCVETDTASTKIVVVGSAA